MTEFSLCYPYTWMWDHPRKHSQPTRDRTLKEHPIFLPQQFLVAKGSSFTGGIGIHLLTPCRGAVCLAQFAQVLCVLL